MNIAKYILAVGIGLSSLAQAGTLKCTSVGELLPKNRLVFDAVLETDFITQRLIEGRFAYTDSDNPEVTGSGKFACLKPNENRVTECGLIRPDSNIVEIAAHPVMGFMIQLSDQSHIALFKCTKE